MRTPCFGKSGRRVQARRLSDPWLPLEDEHRRTAFQLVDKLRRSLELSVAATTRSAMTHVT